MRDIHVRLGFVGCGALATAVHLRNAGRIPGVSVMALADPAPTARERAARLAPGAACLESADELLARDDVDAVVVASPSLTHGTLARLVLGAGKHLYLEKPVATSLDDAKGLASSTERAGVVAAVGFNRRFHPLVLAAREHLDRGELGPIAEVRAQFTEPLSGTTLPEWKRRRETGGGAPLDLGSHHVDLVRYLLRAELVGEASDLRSVSSELDDCTLRFRSDGRPVAIGCSFLGPRRDVLHPRGRGWPSAHDRSLRRNSDDRRETARGPRLAAVRARALLRPMADLSYRPALRAFVDRIRGADVAVPTIEDGVASLQAILAAEQAAVSIVR